MGPFAVILLYKCDANLHLSSSRHTLAVMFALCIAAAALPAVLQSAQMRAIVNTVLALLGSCLSTFAASAFVDNRFNIMHVQVPIRHLLSPLSKEPRGVQMLRSPLATSNFHCITAGTHLMRSDPAPVLTEGWRQTTSCSCVLCHAQNSSLAGGVAIGAAASLYMTPGGERLRHLLLPPMCPWQPESDAIGLRAVGALHCG